MSFLNIKFEIKKLYKINKCIADILIIMNFDIFVY